MLGEYDHVPPAPLLVLPIVIGAQYMRVVPGPARTRQRRCRRRLAPLVCWRLRSCPDVLMADDLGEHPHGS
jgi:hypothetical protein